MTHMTEKETAQQMHQATLELVQNWDIAGYIHDDIGKFVRSLNSWKMQGLQKNMTMFKRFVYLLDDQNTKQIGCDLKDPYFMSKRGRAIVLAKMEGKKGVKSDNSQSRIVRIMSKVAAMFVFQAAEFCNGSRDRMQIIDFSKIRTAIVRRMKETAVK